LHSTWGFVIATAPETQCPDIDNYVLTQHALSRLIRRRVDGRMIDEVLRAPGQRAQVREGRCVYQALIEDDGTKVLRVFVDVDRDPPEVVTAYLSNKVNKYWGQP
jgi:hypothetical protein